MKFYCRENELKSLHKRYKGEQFECVIFYGRRRVGKTSLINEFCKDKKVIYFSALNSTIGDNLEALSKVIWAYKDEKIENAPIFKTLDDAFTMITTLCQQERIIFVIDEYPYLANSDASVSSRLQHLIDHVWQDSKLFLILCGSSMSFMQHQVLGYESPLYGRRTAQYKIEPLTYKDTACFLNNCSYEEKAYVYGITGGIPHYINKLHVESDLKEALLENVFDASSYLFEEPENLLKQELREPVIYNAVITAIANGASKLNEISTKVGIETGACVKYLKNLSELGIINKECPITEENGKKTIYKIEDNFFRFWYRFVSQNIASIQTRRIEKSIDGILSKNLHDYMGLIFEKMCKDYLLYYADDLPIDLASVGQWWGTDKTNKKEVQIDLVGTSSNDKGEYLIGSCKFKNEKIGIDELNLLIHYADVFGKGKKYHYYIFALNGFTDALIKEATVKNVHLITLEQMY